MKSEKSVKNTLDDQSAEIRLSKVAPIIRGLLAEPSGDENIPYRRVILRSLTDEKVRDFPQIPLKNTKMLPLYVNALEYNASPEKLHKNLFAVVEDYSRINGSKPKIVLLQMVNLYQSF